MSKPDLIFIHGFRGSPLGLEELTKHFSEARVFTPAIPPFGNSKALSRYDKKTYADFIASFIRDNNLKHPILVGHSMGSLVAAATAEKYPDLIDRRLFFLAPISKRPALIFTLLEPLLVFIPNHIISILSTKFLYVKSPRRDNKQFFRTILDLTHRCAANYTSRSDVLKAAIFSSSHSLDEFNFHKTQKIILISGAKDRLIAKSATNQLAKKLHADNHFIPESGHLINYETPGKIAAIINHYLV